MTNTRHTQKIVDYSQLTTPHVAHPLEISSIAIAYLGADGIMSTTFVTAEICEQIYECGKRRTPNSPSRFHYFALYS